MTISHTDIAIDGTTAWLVGPDYTPAFIATLTRPCDLCDGRKGTSGIIPYEYARYRTPCPGRHTFTLDVEPTPCTIDEDHYIGTMEWCACSPDIATITVHVVEVLPIVEWDTVDLGLPHAVPCMTIDPHGNGLEVTERDAHDYFGINRTLPTSAAPGKYAVQLEVHA
jgi:hypothetical protein